MPSIPATELEQTASTESRPSPIRWGPHVALALVLLAMAVLRFWRSPAEAGGMLVAPDGAEYAVAAHRLATLGTLDIDVGGARYPIRYPPTFSAALLAPVYAIAPGEIGNGIIVVQAFALLLVAAAYVAGYRIAGIWGAAAAGVAVIGHDLLAKFARTIMTDLPVAALTVAALAVFLSLRRESGLATWCLAGFLAALAAGLRPLAAALLLPFLVMIAIDRRRALPKLALQVLPMAALVAASGWYNHGRFGSWRRTGYQFWCPIPYEFPSLTFSSRYFWENVDLFAHPAMWLALLGGIAGLVAMFGRQSDLARRVAAFAALTALPISALHLYYFHVEPRFHAPLIALCCTIGAAGVVLLLPRRWRERPWIAVALAAVALGFVRLPKDVYGVRPGRSVVQRLATFVPQGGTIITRGDPVQLDPIVLRPGGRHWIPIWRKQNYAGHAIAPLPIDLPAEAVNWPGTHRAPALFKAGARDAVPWTALERPDLIMARVVEGPGVFLDATTVPPGSEPYKRVAQLFDLRPVDPEGEVLRLSAKSTSREGR
ncbi:MAG: hypothetical protein WBD40_12480 [Tepidisphaeraceae bacterium]